MYRVALKDISLLINSGLTPLRSNEKFWHDGDIPWVKTEQLGKKNIYDSNEKITKFALEHTSIKLNPRNTLSVAMYGEGKTRGSVSILRNETTTNQACCNIVIDKDKADFEFVYYYLKTQYNNLRNLSSGVRKNLNSNDIKNFKISLPSLSEQKQISKVLSDLDAKIEVNNKINAELEALAKTIYDYWFVQFDFPDQNGKPYKSSGGKMVYNEQLKREIPEGWTSNTMADWIESDANGDWGESEPTGNYTVKVNCIRGADLPSLDGLKENQSPLRYIHENKTHKILESNDLIVEISGGSPTQSTGRISFVTEETFKRYEAPLICANFCKAVRLKEPKNLYNFYYTWKEAFEQGNMFNYEGKTSGIRNLLFSSLVESFKVPIPDAGLVEKFYEFMKPIQKQKQRNLLENQKLAALRDWLLPMLMNGQATVRSPEEVRDKGEAKEQLGMVAEESEKYKA